MVAFTNRFVVLIFLLALKSVATAQATNSITDAGMANALHVYHELLYPETALYNGREYNDYNYPFSSGTPYFNADSLTVGSVVYDEILYENVLMKYNAVTEQLVIADPTYVYHIALSSKHVNHFSLLNSDFLNLPADSNKVIKPGFYQVLYEGKTAVYKKLQKRIDEKITLTQGLTKVVYESNSYFISKDGNLYSVARKKQLLNVFSNQKKDLQQYLRKHKLNLRRDKDNALISVAGWYDELKK